jgi:hypothetical protein
MPVKYSNPPAKQTSRKSQTAVFHCLGSKQQAKGCQYSRPYSRSPHLTGFTRNSKFQTEDSSMSELEEISEIILSKLFYFILGEMGPQCAQ